MFFAVIFAAVAVHERDGVHGLFTFGLELFDDDEVAVGAFNHERGRGFAVETGSLAEDVGDAEDAGFQDDAGFAEEFVFWFWETLIGDDLAEEFGGGVFVGLEERHGFVEFAAEGGFRVVLGSWFEAEDWGVVGLVSADVRKVVDKPSCAGFGEGLINGGFVEREIFESGLVIDRASVHGLYELHDREAKIFVAGEDGGFDRGGAAIFRQKGGVEVQNAFGLEKFKEVGFNHDAERGENAIGVGIFAFQSSDFGEIFTGAGMKNDVGFLGEDGFCEVGERAVTKKDDFWKACGGGRSFFGHFRLLQGRG